MRPWRRAMGVAALWLGTTAGGSSSPRDDRSTAPHIVFVLGDDVGNNDVGWHNPEVLTPTLDALARSGVELAAHYTWNWCAPTRAMLMTGRYVSLHIGAAGGGGSSSTAAVAAAFPFVAEPLRDLANYSTYMLGKWHLGHANESRLPVHRGFQHSLGYLTGQEDYYCRTVGASCPNVTATSANPAQHRGARPGKCPSPSFGKKAVLYDWWSDNEPGNFSRAAPRHSVYDYTEAAQRIIERHSATRTSPLFLYYASQLVHAPLQVDDRFLELYNGSVWEGCGTGAEQAGSAVCGRQTHNAMMSALDESVKNITATLHSSGLWANTVLVFASDNGGQIGDQGNCLPYRGAKFDSWEGGIRSAAFIAGPLVPAAIRGGVHRGIVSITDWAPTFLSMAGLPNSSMAADSVPAMDGIDLWPALVAPNGSSSPAQVGRTEVYIAPGILRVGRFKLITESPGNRDILGCGGGWIPLPTNASAPPCSKQKVSCAAGQMDPRDLELCNGCNSTSPCLFDVGQNDAEERNNVADLNPGIVSSLRDRLKAIEATAWSPPKTLPNNGMYCEDCKRRGGFNGPWMPLDPGPGGELGQ